MDFPVFESVFTYLRRKNILSEIFKKVFSCFLKFFKKSDIMFLEVNAMPTTLSSIKKDLEGRIGSEIMLVAQTGRKRQTERKGICLLYTSPSPRDGLLSRMPSSA